MHPIAKHVLAIFAIVVFVSLLYSRIPGTYFCGYDDFIEIHRAAFEDTRNPERAFTTTHFDSYKYRPLNRILTVLTYWAGDGKASFFRTRNVLWHLLNIVLVYAIGWLLFGRFFVCGAAALLFGVHPLVNQPVVAASYTITIAHAGFLFSLFCFLFSVRRKPGSLVWLCLALLSAWLGIWTYESSVSAFPLVFAYLLIQFAFTRERLVNRRFLLVLTVGTVLLVASFFGMRLLFVSVGARQAIPNAKTMVKAALMDSVALLSPVDAVLANEWCGAPLPSEIHLSSVGKLWWVVLLLSTCAAGLVVLLRKPLAQRLRASDWPNLVFLLIAIIMSLLPFVVLTLKPSETYLYMSVAFAALLFSSLLETVLGAGTSRSTRSLLYGVAVGILVVSFSCATWVRNNRVVRCGNTAKRIMSNLRLEKLNEGLWFVNLAAAPSEPRSRRYGLYGWRGIDTVGESALEPALQWVNNNEMLAARMVGPEFFEKGCIGSRDVCFWVHEDGRVVEVGQKLAGK
jgi:hypothetical protein